MWTLSSRSFLTLKRMAPPPAYLVPSNDRAPGPGNTLPTAAHGPTDTRPRRVDPPLDLPGQVEVVPVAPLKVAAQARRPAQRRELAERHVAGGVEAVGLHGEDAPRSDRHERFVGELDL